MLAGLVRIVVPLIGLAGAVLGARYMFQNPPESRRGKPRRLARLVEVRQVSPTSHKAIVEAMGHVRPARQVQLRPKVAGPIEWVNKQLEPGAVFDTGGELMRIEQRDYEIAKLRRESEVKIAESQVTEARKRLAMARKDLQVERGAQAVALQDYEALGEEIAEENRDLVLRKPQLEAARAEVEAAQAAVESATAALTSAGLALEEAQLDVKRTTIVAPFPVVVVAKRVDKGDTVSTSTPVVELMGTEEFWVEVSLPQSDLRWIVLPRGKQTPGSTVRVYNPAAWGPKVYRTGKVIRQLPGVDQAGRMARILVSIPDPLGLKDPEAQELLAEDYVKAEIYGRELENIIDLPRSLVRSGDQVWILTDEGKLEIRPIDIAYRSRDIVAVQGGLAAGERVVVTDLAAPVEGMDLRTAGQGPPSARASSQDDAQAGGSEQTATETNALTDAAPEARP